MLRKVNTSALSHSRRSYRVSRDVGCFHIPRQSALDPVVYHHVSASARVSLHLIDSVAGS